ncbi:MAG: GDSL-type esterase/lipase family protein [Xanthobacteraceae bacterium]
MTALSRRLAFALSLMVAGVALAAPAGAQLAHGPAAFDQSRRPEPVQFRDFWDDRRWSSPNNSYDSFWGDRRPFYPNRSYDPYNPSYRRPQVYESSKPPTPRKVETPPAETVLVIGDTFGEWLAYGLEQVFAETPQIGIVRKIKPDLSLVRDDARLGAPEWTQAVKDLLPATERPNVIVVMLGVSDRSLLRDRAPATKESTIPPNSERPAPAAVGAQRQPPGASYEFHTDKWAELYAKRIDDMIAALKTRGVPIMWVGLPAIRGAKSTSDMSYLDELYRARAEKAGITYVDIWDGFVDAQGHYAQEGPDFEGQTRRLRTYDGVYFTKAGAEKLGHYVEHDLRRVLTSHVLPVALPGPEEQSPANDAAAGRPAIGPVLPLNATGTEKSGELLGAASHPAERDADPLATRVLSRGEAIVAPRGRADDFSWPRPDTSGSADTGSAPDAVPPRGSVGTNDTGERNKNDANKPETMPKPHITIARPRSHGDQSNGAPPRPPLPVGPAASNPR